MLVYSRVDEDYIRNFDLSSQFLHNIASLVSLLINLTGSALVMSMVFGI